MVETVYGHVLHFGLAHLANNMIVLFWTGDRLERLIGKWRYLIIYVGAGLCGNLLSLLVTQGKGTLTVSAGASGAILVYLELYSG